MGRRKFGQEPRNWPLNVKVQKSVAKYLDNLVTKLGWSKASFLIELILRFGQILTDDILKEQDSTEIKKGCDPSNLSPPVTGENET